VLFQLFPAAQVGQVHYKAELHHFPTQFLDQPGRRQGGAAGGDKIIDDQDFLAFLDRILVDLDGIGPVF